jgi:hypothetical protein
VTVVSGPCNAANANVTSLSQYLARWPTIPGCGVRMVANSSLVPTLLRDATVNTSQPLLIRLVSNVTLTQRVTIRRPVLMLGALWVLW